jgi:hypothetical protein
MLEASDGYIYAGTWAEDTTPAGDIFRSNNGGATWSKTSTLAYGPYVFSLLEASDGYLYAGTGNYGYVFRANSASNYSAVANAEASVYGDKSLVASRSMNALALLAVPIGAVIVLRLWCRKR